MSAQDFLQDFYKRLEAAHHYSQRLEYDLHYFTERFKLSLVELQQTLAAVQHQLDGERLEHSATREELEYERQRHRETDKLCDLTYNAVEESTVVIESLRARIIELQENQVDLTPVPKTEDVILELQVTEEQLKFFKDWVSLHNLNSPIQDSGVASLESSSG
jgi:hypothetical protein